MNILHIQISGDLKRAFAAGLIMAGVEDNQILWLGTQEQFNKGL
jgi:hypothetical protein